MLDGTLNDCKVCKDETIGQERCDTKLDWENNKYDCLNPKNCLEVIESKKPITITQDVPIDQYWNQVGLTEYLFKQKYKMNSSGGGNGLLLFKIDNRDHAIKCITTNRDDKFQDCCIQGEITWGQERNISSIQFNKILYQDDCYSKNTMDWNFNQASEILTTMGD